LPGAPGDKRVASDGVPGSWEEARNVLCVRLDTLGDVLMTTPAIRALRESRADRRLTLLTSSSGAEVASLVPEIDETIVYDAPWLKATASRDGTAYDHAMIELLRRKDFDAAVVFTVYSQNPMPSVLMCYLADIPLRLAHCRENPYQLLSHWVKETEPETQLRHEVKRQLDLVATAGCSTDDVRLSLRIPVDSRKRVQSILASLSLAPEQPWVVIHPGVTAPSRRYPWEAFADVAHHLRSELGWEVFFTGTEQERDLVVAIQGAMDAPSYSLVGRLDLGGLAALLSYAHMLISNNTGPVHMAAAVGTPTVDLYAMTNPQHTPWGIPNRVLNHEVPCKYCYKSICPEGHYRCLRLVPPDAVIAAVVELSMETASPRPVWEDAGEY